MADERKIPEPEIEDLEMAAEWKKSLGAKFEEVKVDIVYGD